MGSGHDSPHSTREEKQSFFLQSASSQTFLGTTLHTLPCANEGPTWLTVMRHFYVRDFRLWCLFTGLLLKHTAAFKISTGRQKRDREEKKPYWGPAVLPIHIMNIAFSERNASLGTACTWYTYSHADKHMRKININNSSEKKTL